MGFQKEVSFPLVFSDGLVQPRPEALGEKLVAVGVGRRLGVLIFVCLFSTLCAVWVSSDCSGELCELDFLPSCAQQLICFSTFQELDFSFEMDNSSTSSPWLLHERMHVGLSIRNEDLAASRGRRCSGLGVEAAVPHQCAPSVCPTQCAGSASARRRQCRVPAEVKGGVALNGSQRRLSFCCLIELHLALWCRMVST